MRNGVRCCNAFTPYGAAGSSPLVIIGVTMESVAVIIDSSIISMVVGVKTNF